MHLVWSYIAQNFIKINQFGYILETITESYVAI